MLSRFSRLRRALVAFLGAGALLMSPMHPAHAYGFVRFGFGFPIGFGFPVFTPFFPFYGPRVIVAPAPVVYSAPTVVYTQPAPSVASGRCYAAAYVCPLRRPLVAGTPCSCPTNTGRIVGEVG